MSRFRMHDIEVEEAPSGKFKVLSVSGKPLLINLLSFSTEYNQEEVLALQDRHLENGVNLVNLWEDVWISRNEQVMARVWSLLGLNQRIHARKTKIIPISQSQSDEFLNANHIQGTARSKYRFALSIDDKIVSVACFSNLRQMKRSHPGEYRSAEVIRFASLAGYTVTGGFSKLLKYFILQYKPDDVMSYADRDWSSGKVYEQAGFKLVSVSGPAIVYVDRQSLIRYFPHRLPVRFATTDEKGSEEVEHTYLKIFNTGNLKYLYYL